MLARSKTIAGCCTDQCHTASVLSWRCLGGCAVSDMAKGRWLNVPSLLAGHLLDIEVMNGTPAVDSKCTFHPLSDQRLVGLTMRPKTVVLPISGCAEEPSVGTTGVAVREWHKTFRAKREKTCLSVRITVFSSATVIDVIVHCHTAGAL